MQARLRPCMHGVRSERGVLWGQCRAEAGKGDAGMALYIARFKAEARADELWGQ